MPAPKKEAIVSNTHFSNEVVKNSVSPDTISGDGPEGDNVERVAGGNCSVSRNQRFIGALHLAALVVVFGVKSLCSAKSVADNPKQRTLADTRWQCDFLAAGLPPKCDGRDRIWPNLIWPSLFGRIWPNRIWPIPHLAKVNWPHLAILIWPNLANFC